MAELTIWWVIRLLVIGFAIGYLIADLFVIQPIFSGWDSCMQGWRDTLTSLNQCSSLCNLTVQVVPENPLGEVVQV